MNNIIQNLAIQAAGKGFNTFSTSDLDTQEKIERFAELIVSECIAITNEQYFAYEAVEALQKHFGVKE